MLVFIKFKTTISICQNPNLVFCFQIDFRLGDCRQNVRRLKSRRFLSSLNACTWPCPIICTRLPRTQRGFCSSMNCGSMVIVVVLPTVNDPLGFGPVSQKVIRPEVILVSRAMAVAAIAAVPRDLFRLFFSNLHLFLYPQTKNPLAIDLPATLGQSVINSPTAEPPTAIGNPPHLFQ